jgi:glycosyltransferase involved in cell wall biosynthesis
MLSRCNPGKFSPENMRWALITGEYPPQLGGVGDYTQLVARGLADCGDEVHVWTPAAAGRNGHEPGIAVHGLPGRFGPRSLVVLDRDLNRLPRPYRVLVQYVPHAFGWKAMNVPFCGWLLSRRRDGIWVMFHEVAFPISARQTLAHNILGAVTRAMAWMAVRAAERSYVSIPAWETLLRRMAPGRRIAWLPVFANVPVGPDPGRVAAVRKRIASSPDGIVVGHFGTFGPLIAPLLEEVLPSLLMADVKRAGLLVGVGSEDFAAYLLSKHPQLAGRLHGTGALRSVDVAINLAATDVVVQPYPDGISTRRSSAMAGLALALPIVTTEGPLTESLWKGAVHLAPAGDPRSFVEAVEELLADTQRLNDLRQRAAELYADRFALKHTVEQLRS